MKEYLEELADSMNVNENLVAFITIFGIYLAATIFGVLGGMCLIITMIKAKAIALLIPIIAGIGCEIVMLFLTALVMCFLQILIERYDE